MNLPETWRLVRLKDIVLDTQPGFAQRPDQDEGALPQIRTHNVSPDGQIDMAGIKSVSASDSDIAKYALQPDDIVFNNTNSEEWVGKTALFEATGTYLFSNHMTRLRANRDLVEPAYLARYLHFLWQTGFTKQRAKRWVSQAAVDQTALREFKVAMPPLLEQQRIVAILGEAGELHRQQTATLAEIESVSHKLFSNLFPAMAGYRKVRLGEIATTKYGTSKSSDISQSETNFPVLRIPNVLHGRVDREDMKHVQLTVAERDSLSLKYGDVLVVRSNGNPDYVGRCAAYEENKELTVYASYLIRIRADLDTLLPEYLAALLRSPTGRQLLKPAIRTTAGQSNISGESLANLRIPVPPLEKQKQFRKTLSEIETLRSQAAVLSEEYRTLLEGMATQAFSGRLTETWRAYNHRELEAAARERDRALAGQIKITITEHAPEERQRSLLPERNWLMDQLSVVQQLVWEALVKSWRGTLIPSEEGALTEFRQRSFQIEHLENADDRILRALEQLAGLGLIAKVSVRNEEGEYVTAFRPLRDEERSRGDDIATLSGPRG